MIRIINGVETFECYLTDNKAWINGKEVVMIVNKFVSELVGECLWNLNSENNLKSKMNVTVNKISVLDKYIEVSNRLHLIGLGKSASYDVQALLTILRNQNFSKPIGTCLSYTKIGDELYSDEIRELAGNHPIVSKLNIDRTQQFIESIKEIPEGDSVLFILSGGASALLEEPIDGISLDELIMKHEEIVNSGLNINEMNNRRKKLSKVKNGGLLKYFNTRDILQLIACDVPNDDLFDVSSGPLLSVDNIDTNPKTVMIQSSTMLLEKLISSKKYNGGKIYNCPMEEMISDLSFNLPKNGEAFVSGGEGTIDVPIAHGKGGRNTHFVLAMANQLYKSAENRDLKIMSFGTDGGDGNTDAAGAYIDYELFQKIKCDIYLKNFDTYNYFKNLNSLIKTGPTGSNVSDIRCLWRD